RVDLVDLDDHVAGTDPCALRGRAFYGRHHLDAPGGRSDLESQAAAGRGVPLQVLELILVEVAGIRIDLVQQTANGAIHHLLIIDDFDELRLDRTVDLHESAQLLHLLRRDLALSCRRHADGQQDADGDAGAENRRLPGHAVPFLRPGINGVRSTLPATHSYR